MNVLRGDVVLVDFPFATGGASKVRPAVIIQNDLDNSRLTSTIAAQITGTTHRAFEATQVFIEIATPDGQRSGLRIDSVINCANIFTLAKTRVIRHIGKLSPTLLSKLNDALKVALDIP